MSGAGDGDDAGAGVPANLNAELRRGMTRDLAAIGRMRMPFGKFGPQNYPPDGVPIYDLPAEYLGYFMHHGWPKGRLGELLKIVYQMKVDGLDLIFDEFRRKAGGRTNLRLKRQS